MPNSEKAARRVVVFYWRVAKRAWMDAWPWAHKQGLIVGALAGVFTAFADGIGDQHVHVGHLVIAALAGFGGVMVLLLLGHLILAPVRLYEDARRVRTSGALSADSPEPTFVFQEGSNPVF